MECLPVPRPEICNRLKKIEGQVRGLQKMIEDKRDCVDVIIQLAAAKSALESVAGLVLRNYTEICLKQSGRDVGADLAKAVSMWIGR
jgi:DNA-binding FrmR family transcriptional regulator